MRWTYRTKCFICGGDLSDPKWTQEGKPPQKHRGCRYADYVDPNWDSGIITDRFLTRGFRELMVGPMKAETLSRCHRMSDFKKELRRIESTIPKSFGSHLEPGVDPEPN